MAYRKFCQRPACTSPSAMEVTYIFGKGQRYRLTGAVCQKSEGAVERFVLCEQHAAECITGDDPPWDHVYFNRPKRERIVDETPRFSESWGLA